MTHDIVLDADLLDCPGDGLVATGADITIDLNRHRIDGTGAGAGVRVLGSDVTLRDGRITGFQDGVLVEADGLEEARLARLEISDNRRGVVLAGGFPPSQSGDGVVTVSWSTIHHNENSAMLASLWPHRTQVTGSRIEANGSGLIFRDSRGGTVVGNSITANGLAGLGFDFSPGGRATGNLISRNGTWGLQANRSSGLVISYNALARNGSAGQFGGGAFVLEGLATIERNVFDGNVGNGLLLDEFLDSRSRWQINHNTATRNTEFGIFAVQPGFTGVGNVAKRNGEPSQCFNFPCNRRPR